MDMLPTRTILVLAVALALPSSRAASAPLSPPTITVRGWAWASYCLLKSQSLGYKTQACEAVSAQIGHVIFPAPPFSPTTQAPVSEAQSKVLLTICFIALRNSPINSAREQQIRKKEYGHSTLSLSLCGFCPSFTFMDIYCPLTANHPRRVK